MDWGANNDGVMGAAVQPQWGDPLRPSVRFRQALKGGLSRSGLKEEDQKRAFRDLINLENRLVRYVANGFNIEVGGNGYKVAFDQIVESLQQYASDATSPPDENNLFRDATGEWIRTVRDRQNELRQNSR